MRRCSPLFAAFALLAVPFLAPTPGWADDAGDSESVTLRYQIGKDDQRIQRTTTTVSQEQTVNEQTIKTELKTIDVSVNTLEKVDDEGRFHLQSENKRLKVDMEIGPLGKYAFDSTSTERDKASTIGAAVTPLYERLSGAYLWATITPRGEVVETRGYEELVKDALADNPLASQFAGGGTDQAHRAGAAQALVKWPKDPVAPGDTWEDDLEMTLPKIGKVEGKTKYEFVRIVTEDGVRIAEVTTTPEIAIDIDIEQLGAKIGGRLQTEKTEGRIRFDLTNGWLVSKTESYTIAGTLNVTAGGQNLTIPMKQSQKVEIEALKKLPE